MTEELYENLSEEELQNLEEVKDFDIDKNSFIVSDGICPECNLKMEKTIVNRNLFDGALTFHIISYRCQKCNKGYLDLGEAEKYDLYLSLRKIKRPISYVTASLNNI